MASRSAKGAFGLLLAVVAAIGFAITASDRTGSATATQPSSPPASHGADRSGSMSRAPAAPGRAAPARSTVTSRKTSPKHTSAPAAPTSVTIDSPQGTPILSAPIDPMTAQRNTDGSWVPITPPSLTRAVWMTQSAMPAAPSTGTTAIYGHACIGLICAFNKVANTPPQSTVIVQTRTARLRYRVISLIQYPKVGDQSLASRRDIANQLLLITCAYRPDGSSANNLVLVATLIGA